jgi:ferritin
MIHDLYTLAVEEKDYASQAFLQWFVTEQVEEEDSATQILETLKMIGDKGHALLMLDRELGQRGAD